MRKNHWMILSVLVVAAMVLMVSAAYAGTPPPSTAAVMQKVTFDSANATDTLQPFTTFGGFASGPASWGIVANPHQGSTGGGLWCAGVGGVAPNYPAGTRGLAVLHVSDASQYYQSDIQFSYIEPSLGALDANGSSMPFVVNWSSTFATDSVSPTGFSDAFLPIATTWTSVTYPRGGFAQPPLSAGWLRFQFTSDASQLITGQGPTIDNIQVTGYEFGPVNGLHAARQPGALATVVAGWSKPSARGTLSPDPRSVWYRVWRHDLMSGVWTELTAGSGAITATSYTDANTDVTHQYQYAVQAYDSPSNISQWGVLAAPVTVDQAVPHFVAVGSDRTTISYGSTATISAQLSDGVGGVLTAQASSVSIQQSLDGGATWSSSTATVYERVPGTYSAIVSCPVDTNYRFVYSVTGATSGSIGIHVVVPHFLPASSDKSTVTYGASATISAPLVDGLGAPLVSRTASVTVQQTVDGGATWVSSPVSVSEPSPGTYAAVVSPTADTTYRLSYRFSSTAAGATSTSLPIHVAAPQFLGVSSSNSSVSYGGATTLTAQLTDGVGGTLASQLSNIVVEQSYDGGASWSSSPASIAELTPGTYSAVVSSMVNTTYRFSYTPIGAKSASAMIRASMVLSTPSTPSRVKHSKYFYVTGNVSRAPGTRTVLLRAYHKETKIVRHKRKTVWVLRASTRVYVSAASDSSIASYRIRMKVKQKGSWHMQAVVSDSYNLGVTTGNRSFSAR